MMTVLRFRQSGTRLGIQFQNPWFIGAMAMVMVLFSASLLGLLEIRLPSGASTFPATRGGNRLRGSFPGKARLPRCWRQPAPRAVPGMAVSGQAGVCRFPAVGIFRRWVSA